MDTHLQANESLVQKITEGGEKSHFYECDVTDRNQLNHTIDSIERDVGPPTMIFYGNLLQPDQQNEKLLMSSYVNVSYGDIDFCLAGKFFMGLNSFEVLRFCPSWKSSTKAFKNLFKLSNFTIRFLKF